MAKKTKDDETGKLVSDKIKGKFDLNQFKKSKSLDQNVGFKPQTYIPVSQAVKNALSIPGIPIGQISIARGGSDTGKTTLMLETAVNAQKMGILPVFIITEMKWDFSHAIKMGFEMNIEDNSGFFLYADRSTLNTIEDVAAFIADILNEQEKGRLPHDLLFLWDSVGSIPCQMSVEQGKNNPMWNAGAMAVQFGNFINQKFPLSRKENYPYTNTFFVINKTGVQPADTPMSQPRMTNKGGNAMYWDAALVITFGNVTNSGTSKLKAVKNKKNVEFAKRTKISVDKIHLSEGIGTRATIIVTPHGFIDDSDSAVASYKKSYSKEWFSDEDGDIEIMEDASEWEETKNISKLLVDVDE